MRRIGDLGDGFLEGLLVALRWLAVATYLAYELERGSADVVLTGELVMVT